MAGHPGSRLGPPADARVGSRGDGRRSSAPRGARRTSRGLDVRRGRELGIIAPEVVVLAEHRTPVIVECRSMRRSSASHYKAARRLFDDREVVVLGENEFGRLPDAA